MRLALTSAIVTATVILAQPAATALPSYDRQLLLETTSETSANVSFGDVDGDSNLDIVLAKGRHWPLGNRVLLGDGRGGIRASYDLGDLADRSYSARLVDLDGDGSLDVVVSNDQPDPKLVYLNDGGGHFRVGSTYGRPEWDTRHAAVADLNGDGLADIVVANRTDHGANYVCLNRGNGRFDADCTPFAHYPATTVTPADFNHDGLIDLAVPHRDGGQSYVYLAGPNADFSDARRVAFGPPDATIRMAETADLDGDGLLDIVAIDDRTAVPYALMLGDLNHDGRIDIIVGHVEAPSTILFNDGSGRHFSTVRFGDNKGTVYGFAIGDFNRDGLPDIAAARSEAPNVLYFAAGSR